MTPFIRSLEKNVSCFYVLPKYLILGYNFTVMKNKIKWKYLLNLFLFFKCTKYVIVLKGVLGSRTQIPDFH